MEFEIALNRLRFYAYHGVFDEERKTGNEFTVTLRVWVPCDKDRMREDDLSHTVSYAELYEIVSEEMNNPRNLLETVALSIADRIRGEYPSLRGGEIEIEKMHPPIPGIMGTASVTLRF